MLVNLIRLIWHIHIRINRRRRLIGAARRLAVPRPIVLHAIRRHRNTLVRPSALDSHIIRDRERSRRIPTAEGVDVGDVAVRVFHAHLIVFSIRGINDEGFVVQEIVFARRKFDAIRNASTPLVGDFVHILRRFRIQIERTRRPFEEAEFERTTGIHLFTVHALSRVPTRIGRAKRRRQLPNREVLDQVDTRRHHIRTGLARRDGTHLRPTHRLCRARRNIEIIDRVLGREVDVHRAIASHVAKRNGSIRALRQAAIGTHDGIEHPFIARVRHSKVHLVVVLPGEVQLFGGNFLLRLPHASRDIARKQSMINRAVCIDVVRLDRHHALAICASVSGIDVIDANGAV